MLGTTIAKPKANTIASSSDVPLVMVAAMVFVLLFSSNLVVVLANIFVPAGWNRVAGRVHKREKCHVVKGVMICFQSIASAHRQL